MLGNLQVCKLEIPRTSSSLYLTNLGFTTLLFQLATVSVLEASTFCQMRRQQSPSGEAFMGQSMWSTFLNGSVFSPVPGREALRSLLTQTNELAGVMNNFKRRYVSIRITYKICRVLQKGFSVGCVIRPCVLTRITKPGKSLIARLYLSV